ncbi:methionyl-tRNA formyltransferase [Novisyntrophococcus fermenticellae]|uniref:methionyl-tRNA formyltransferase n=1 Tax=Novisyntrophococcus fermenticellae TaxID=2068655 RepID=UPI001E42FE4E|nr:methionyl-tRNA formyltransferase [Novisyntrophococcus fermenticellae]
MKVVFMGTPDFSVGTLEAIIAAGHEVAGVVTQPDRPKGRGKAMQYTPVKTAAIAADIPVYQPIKVREPEFVELLRQLKPDVIVVVAFGQIIPASILEIPAFGCLNVHASLLPKYRGAAPIQWAVIDGEKESGVTIMRMDAGLDTGDMLAKTVIPLQENETGGSLFDKLSKAGAGLLVDTLDRLEQGEITPEKQPADSPNAYARMIRKTDGRIDWHMEAKNIERLIRGLNPWPSAYTILNQKTLKIWKASVLDVETGKEPGMVTDAGKSGIFVQTGKGVLRLEEVQLEGKKRMSCDAFLRGFQLPVDTRLQ